jgi:hypothetical protein
VSADDGVRVRRLTLMLTTPRIGPGLFMRDAWTALASATHVLARDEDETQLNAIQPVTWASWSPGPWRVCWSTGPRTARWSGSVRQMVTRA